MKFYAFNGCLDMPNEFGSFTVVSRNLNKYFNKYKYLDDFITQNTYVIYPEVYNVERKWFHHIPYLACEYSLAPSIVIDKLNSYKPLVLSISNFAKNNLINSGYSNVETVHLGTDPDKWNKTSDKKFDTFTYLTVNTSNERSGYEKLIPAFVKFSKNKNVNLIIKDSNNKNFKNYIQSLNNDKIIYIDDMLSEDDLKRIYNKSHIFLYTNHTTSFGMNILDSALCGIPSIVTLGSAIKEFVPEWTQPKKVLSEMKPVNSQSIIEWNNYGIKSFPSNFLSVFNGIPLAEFVIEESILDSLEYSYKNYDEYIDINIKYQDYVLNNFTWDHCIKKIVGKVLENDKFISR